MLHTIRSRVSKMKISYLIWFDLFYFLEPHVPVITRSRLMTFIAAVPAEVVLIRTQHRYWWYLILWNHLQLWLLLRLVHLSLSTSRSRSVPGSSTWCKMSRYVWVRLRDYIHGTQWGLQPQNIRCIIGSTVNRSWRWFRFEWIKVVDALKYEVNFSSTIIATLIFKVQIAF